MEVSGHLHTPTTPILGKDEVYFILLFAIFDQY
jgi:hypothetical protein